MGQALLLSDRGFNIDKKFRKSFKTMETVGTIITKKDFVYGLKFSDSIYIGVTSNIYTRLAGHLGELRSGKHKCAELQQAFNQDQQIEVVLVEELTTWSADAAVRLQIETDAAVRLSEKFKVVSTHVYNGPAKIRGYSFRGTKNEN